MLEHTAAAADSTASPGFTEPQDDGPVFAETDPTGRYGRFEQRLGRGAFKTVYKAFDTQEGTEVAWNQVTISELVNGKDSKEERDRLFAEIRVLKQLKHKNIMTFYDYWLDPKTMNINFITELFTSGTLRQYRKRHKQIDEEVLKRWAWQILCGLVYLHGHAPPIIHRDLKCDNIFINGSDGTVKIGDLGLATMLRNRTAPQSVLGTPEFMAPELYEEEYDDRVDVYSFGMCMLELATMEYPYAECKNAAQIYRKVSLGVRPAGLQNVTNQELADFINVCISPREKRPRSRMLLKHPYFDSIRPPCQIGSKSQVGLASIASQLDNLSDYGSGLSRSSSTIAELAVSGTPQPGPLSPTPSIQPPQASNTACRAVSGVSDGSYTDAASIKSHRSTASEAAAGLSDITEETGGATQLDSGGCEQPLALGSPSADGPMTTQSEAFTRGSPAPSKTQSPVRTRVDNESPTDEEFIMDMEVEEGMAGEERECEECIHDGERSFAVVGKYQEDNDTFSLRLRICEPGGQARTVEFEFDVSRDTAISVASEMVEDLQLSQEDAAAIAAAIRDEIATLTTNLEEQLSLSLEQTSAALQEGLYQSAALANSSPSPSFMEHAAKLISSKSLQTELIREEQRAGKPSVSSIGAPDLPDAHSHAEQVVTPAEGQLIGVVEQPGQGFPVAASAQVHSVHFAPGPLPADVLSQHHAVSLTTAKSLGSTSSLHSAASSHTSVETATSLLTAVSHLSGVTSEEGRSAALLPSHRPFSPPARVTSPSTLPGLPTGQPVSAAAALSPPASHPALSRLLRASPAGSPGFGRAVTMPVREKEPMAAPVPMVGHSQPSSGALSPSTSGVLSPALSADKRIPLNKLFENLHDLAACRLDTAGGGPSAPGPQPSVASASSSGAVSPRQHLAGLAAAGVHPTPTGLDRLPPLPAGLQPRAMNGSLSGGALSDVPTRASSLTRPASEASLSTLVERFDPFNLSLASASDPTEEVVLPVQPTSLPFSTAVVTAPAALSPSRISSPGTGAAVGVGAWQGGQHGHPHYDQRLVGPRVTASGSKTSSCNASPPRSANTSPTFSPTLSPTRTQAVAAACEAAEAAAALLANGSRKAKTDAHKEALRKQAADAMKAVELRSLNLLEGGLLAGKTVRGTPMAATKLTGLGPACQPGIGQPASINAIATPAACQVAASGLPATGMAPSSMASPKKA